MGTYYTKEQFDVGTPVQVVGGKPFRPPAGKKLVMKLDRTTRVIYPDVTSPDDFEEFYSQYDMGYWITYQVRAIEADSGPRP